MTKCIKYLTLRLLYHLVFVQVLMFSEEECWIIFTLLAAILHLGNLRFQGKIHSVPVLRGV